MDDALDAVLMDMSVSSGGVVYLLEAYRTLCYIVPLPYVILQSS